MSRVALSTVVIAAVLGFAPPASASPPVITLLTPKNGATIASPAYSVLHTKFSWHITWDAPEMTTITFQTSTDPNFAPGTGSGEPHTCTAADVNCFSSYTPQTSYGPPYPHIFYWRVGMTTSAGEIWSPTYMVKIVNLADRVKPRVRVLPGSARRGTQAVVRVRAADDRGRIRLHVTIEQRGRRFYNARMPWTITYWADPLIFLTTTPLPRFFPAGRYLACAKVWDLAGNHARSCAPYRVL